jgi:hypothetical protein
MRVRGEPAADAEAHEERPVGELRQRGDERRGDHARKRDDGEADAHRPRVC